MTSTDPTPAAMTSDPTAGCPCPSRRAVLRSAALAGGSIASVGLLAACGSSESTSPATAGPSGTGGSSAPSSTTLGPVSDVPVGGGTIFADAQVVVTQPTEGDYLAFSSTCTHQGCQVGEVTDGEIVCPCHGSHFSIEDGSAVAGPATAPLPAQKVSADGDQLVLG